MTSTSSSSSNTVGEIMTERLETVTSKRSAKEAATKMMGKNVSSLAVIDENGKPVGILTERDFVRRLCTTDKQSSQVSVQEIMTAQLKTVDSDTPIDEAADIMVRNKIRHLMVVDKDEKREESPIGIISATDIVAYVRENSQTMAQVDREVLEALEKEGRFYF